jgi:hypothetical protein
MGLRTYLFPQSSRGYKDKNEFSEPDEIRSKTLAPAFDSHDAALNDGPPPVRIMRQYRFGLSGWGGLAQHATTQWADSLSAKLNLSPMLIPRRAALRGSLAGLHQANSLAVPSVFVPVSSVSK